jgi:hypothetical protein
MNRLIPLSTSIFLLVILLASLQCSPSYAETFTGKVVDDKGTPIVDAVVVGIWQEVRDFITGGFTRIKDVKETTTDTDGVWSLKGPSGAQSNSGLGDFLGIVSFVTGIQYPSSISKCNTFRF